MTESATVVNKDNFSNRIYEARCEARITNRALAEALGVTERTVAGWQAPESRPRSRPSYERLAQLAQLLGKPVSYFLEEVA